MQILLQNDLQMNFQKVSLSQIYGIESDTQ